MKISDELLNEIGSKKIKCALYYYYDSIKDQSIKFTLPVGYTQERLNFYFESIDFMGYPECDGIRRQVMHEVWLETGEYKVRGTYLILGTQSYEPIPDELIK